MNSHELRQTFLNYFSRNEHTIVSSSSLVPGNDPTLLFTNAGMVQFKEVFLGQESRNYVRAATVQRCVRAGGKHNDLENVGYTARHHTFFEMLGNFSFGDYFKREAIHFAWNFLTRELQLPPEKLWVTVYEKDQEAEDIWLKEMKIDPLRFSRCGEKDNFWSMGDTGPCGPCTEIFYDHGDHIPGGPPGTPDQEGDRYIEIWNLVFMQYNRSADGTMTPLPKPSVDTGMGLERIAAVLQGVHSNYEIDIFRHLIQAAASVIGIKQENQASLRVIADHIRSAAFLMTDGVMPSNEGRGYVLRRIIRRAVRHGHHLGCQRPFFHQLVEPLSVEMGKAYPELLSARLRVEKMLKQEEDQFAETLDQGMKLLDRALTSLKGDCIPGNVIFRLYDTYGFPPDLTADIARERGLRLDQEGFECEMKKQRKQSQETSQFDADYSQADVLLKQLKGETLFSGYDCLSDEAAITAIISDGRIKTSLQQEEEGAIMLDRTPFYAESGGQIGDRGRLFSTQEAMFEVHDTQKQGMIYLHYGRVLAGQFKVGDKVTAEVSASRHDTMRNHSATHLLHAALRRCLGEHVIQKGSFVESDRLRFDFSHFAPLTPVEIQSVEHLVNEQIWANLPCHVDFMSAKDAQKLGAMALFGEKYGDEVRVLKMGEFSMELCGGTHVSHTGQIGSFKIISEAGVAAGIRRIEAITGRKALEWAENLQQQLESIAGLLKVSPEDSVKKLEQLLEHSKLQEKQLQRAKRVLLDQQLSQWVQKSARVHGVSMVIEQMPDVDAETLRTGVDYLKQKLLNAVILLATVRENKVILVGGVTKSLIVKIKAGDLVAFAAKKIGGKGGGRPDLAQGGGDDVKALENALKDVFSWIEQQLEPKK